MFTYDALDMAMITLALIILVVAVVFCIRDLRDRPEPRTEPKPDPMPADRHGRWVWDIDDDLR